MKISRLAGLACLLVGAVAQAQDVKINILTEFWYTQMMDSSLRNNAAIGAPTSKYYGVDSRFLENTFNLKRAEIYCNYKISDEWAGYIMFDPSLTNTSAAAATATTASGSVLQDWVITYTPAGTGLFVKGGQMKMPTTYESTLLSARDILFFDRTQMSRIIGERRDRGVWAGYTYGDPKGWKGTINFAISNGSTDDGTSGKTAVDNNASKDYTIRYDGSYTAAHRFGIYYRTGQTNLKYPNLALTTVPATWTAAGVSLQNIKDNLDKTTAEGLFYAYNEGNWHFDAEYSTGLIGRRFPILQTAAAAPVREHLDQKFTGYALTGAYRMGQHMIAARYDMMNYNSGDDFYGTVNPYKPTTGAYAGSDLSPKYTETTLGYNYTFVPNKYTYGKLKVDYIIRSKNFLAPDPGTTAITGGNSLVCSVMVGF
jgi:hypothetical protein